MNKKAITAELLVKITAIMIAAIVILTVFWPVYSHLITGKGKMAECNWNLFLSAAVSAGTFGLTEIPVACQANYLTVDNAMLEGKYKLAKKRITKYHTEGQKAPEKTIPTVGLATQGIYQPYAEAAQAYKLDEKGPTYDAMAEWSMNQIMATKLADCWDKVWKGKLEVFDDYWVGDRAWCVVCDVISFAPDLPVAVNNQESINNLYEMMKAEPHYKTTYLDYVNEGVTTPHFKESLFYTTTMPQAIVYREVKESTFSRWWAPVATGLSATGLVAFTIVTAGGGTAAIGAMALAKAAVTKTAIGVGVAAGAGVGTEDDETTKQLFIHPYELLQKPVGLQTGGLGCTDIIA